MSGIARVLSEHVTDLVFLAGTLILCVGVWWLMPAAALIVGGLLILALAVGAEIAGRTRETEQ